MMSNLNGALAALNLTSTVKVILPLQLGMLGNAWPPSAGAFDNSVTELQPLLQLLNASGAPLAVSPRHMLTVAGF